MTTAAQRAAYQRLRPNTDLHGVGEVKVLDELAGKLLAFEPLGIVLAYEDSFRSNIDGEVYHRGILVAQGPGTGYALGSRWGARGDRLRVLEGISEQDVESRRAAHRRKARRPEDVEPRAGIENAGCRIAGAVSRGQAP